MPLFALGLNIAWELIYSIDTGLSGHFNVQEIANISWFILDAVILFIYFKFEKRIFRLKRKKYFMPFTILAVVSCFVMQFAFYFHFRGIPAAQYSAFAQNAAMSILFLTALYTRNTTKRSVHADGSGKMDRYAGSSYSNGYYRGFQYLYCPYGRNLLRL